MLRDIDNFYQNKDEPAKSCLLALRSIILAHHPAITETTKYGMPCFCYHKKALCYLWTDKKTGEPYVLMVDGKHLNHPMLEQGDRARMKILRIDPSKDIDVGVVKEVLGEGVDYVET